MSRIIYIIFLLGFHSSGKSQFTPISKEATVSFIAKPVNTSYFTLNGSQEFKVIRGIDSLSLFFSSIYIEERFLKGIKIEPNSIYKITGFIFIKEKTDLSYWGRPRKTKYIYIKPTLSSILIQKHLEIIN